MHSKPRLGELLLEKGLIDQNMLSDALRMQVGGNRRLGNILVRMQSLTEDQLAEILAEQLQVEITSIDGEISPDALKILPRYLCKKYDVLPLRFGQHNTVEVAMADPSDDQTIRDLEQYTDRAVTPRLAKQSEISAGIKKHIPFSLNDLVSPQATNFATRVAIAFCLVLIISVSVFTYKYIHRSTYGTVSYSEQATIYKNHDLMVALNTNGEINLLGRGAYAKGYYSIAFKEVAVLERFIESREKDFSADQKQWLGWAIQKISEKAQP